jgi:hypothetical protein
MKYWEAACDAAERNDEAAFTARCAEMRREARPDGRREEAAEPEPVTRPGALLKMYSPLEFGLRHWC